MISRIAITVSLAAALAALALGAISYWRPWVLQHVPAGSPKLYMVRAGFSNGIAFCTMHVPLSSRPASYHGPYHSILGINFYWQQRVDGFGYLTNDGEVRNLGPTQITCYRAPLWLLASLFAVFPFASLIQARVRRRWRRKMGMCVDCGYRLTGNVSGRCPECGSDSKGIPNGLDGSQ